MILNFKKHNFDLYNSLLNLSRNIFFYDQIFLKDTFETRIYLMFIHFSIMMIIYKKKGEKFNQYSYDTLFNNIENNLRELGFGDIAVNKKMKDLNKVLYDILLKLELEKENKFTINKKLIFKYFQAFDNDNQSNYTDFESYFVQFYDFCFGLQHNNMIKGAIKFEFNYGGS